MHFIQDPSRFVISIIIIVPLHFGRWESPSALVEGA